MCCWSKNSDKLMVHFHRRCVGYLHRESFATITCWKQQNRKWLNTFLQLPTYAANVRSRFTLQQITNNIDNIKSDNNNSNLHLENIPPIYANIQSSFRPTSC